MDEASRGRCSVHVTCQVVCFGTYFSSRGLLITAHSSIAQHQQFASIFPLFNLFPSQHVEDITPLWDCALDSVHFWTIFPSAGSQACASHRTSTHGTTASKPVAKAYPPGGGAKPPLASPSARASNAKAAAGGPSPSVVRQNACKKYEEALAKAKEKMTTQPVAEVAKLAQAVEVACHTAFGAPLAHLRCLTLLPLSTPPSSRYII